MYEEAYRLLMELPEDIKRAPAGRRALLRTSCALGRWKMVLELAVKLRTGNQADRQQAAIAFHALTAEACKRGRVQDARKLAAAAVMAFPDQLSEMMADKRLPADFRSKLA